MTGVRPRPDDVCWLTLAARGVAPSPGHRARRWPAAGAAQAAIAQAWAHSAPTLGNEFKVVNWLRTAAIIVGIDPVQAGYLTIDASGNFRLPPLRQLGSVDLLAAGHSNLLAEYTIHNLSDADFTFSIPAVGNVQVLLAALAPRFGFDPADTTRFNTKFRNVALGHLSAERLLVLYGTGGLDAVADELTALRRRGVL